MTTGTYILSIGSAALVLFVVVEMLRRRRLRERHALWWIGASLLSLLVAIFPQVLERASDLVGVAVPTNLVFFVSIAILFFLCLQLSAEITGLEAKTRRLAEVAALHDARLRQLEESTEGP